jgi:hypothetical protein
VKKRCLYSLRMAVCLVTLQRMQELNTSSTAAILLDQAGKSSTLSPGPAMSSTAQATSSTSTIQSIIDALADYTKVTGIDLSKTPFATATEHLTSPEVILKLLQEREKEFKGYRDGNRGRLMNCLSQAVTVVQAFSGIPGEAASLVSHTYHPCNSLMTLSGPVSSRKRLVHWDRCPPCCTSLEYAFQPTPCDK